jgi:SAM-dependent methyltransferase/uncharacterized protein YbaR (Trm112 family)
MQTMRRFLKNIPAVEYCYGRYKLGRYRRSYAPEFARLLEVAPREIPPLALANSLNQFEWVVRHRLLPSNLLERLMPAGPGELIERAFVNFAHGYVAEERLAAVWQRSETISAEAEVRLTEFLNRYITYALRTFGVHIEWHSDPDSVDAIRVRRVQEELEGETGELLDVGCASVLLAEQYATMRRWVGLDLSLPALAIGRIVHGVSPSSLVCGYSEDLPFPDAAFDVVVSSEVLEHTPRPERMIQEIARVLREGGKAVLTVPMHIVDFQDGRQHMIGPTDSTHRFRFHSVAELKALFERHGLAVERLRSHPHYMFTLRRVGSGEPGLQATSVGTILACPDCRGALADGVDGLCCSSCGSSFPRLDGVPVLLPRRLRSARLDLVA